MVYLQNYLELEKCPYCAADRPTLGTSGFQNLTTHDHKGKLVGHWSTYVCSRCGKMILARSDTKNGVVREMYPPATEISEDLPERALHYLSEAVSIRFAPSSCIVTTASAVDAMLQALGYSNGSLYNRIKEAEKAHLITPDMAKWAHEVRLDSNAQRHADDSEPLPTVDDAQRCVDFALALGEILFVLPARVKRGLQEADEGQPGEQSA